MNHLLTLLAVFASLGLDSLSAQQMRQPVIQWQQSVGGSGYEYLYNMVEAPDGSFVFGGLSYSDTSGNKTSPSYDTNRFHPFNSGDWWVVRLDGSGRLVWDRSFGSFGLDSLSTLNSLTDGGIVLGGSVAVETNPGDDGNFFDNQDIRIVRLDSAGRTVWSREIAHAGWDALTSLLPANQDDWLAIGHNYVALLNVDGEVLSKTDKASTVSYHGGATRTKDGGLVQTATVFVFPSDPIVQFNPHFDLLVRRSDASGNTLWEQAYGGTGMEGNPNVVEMPDGGFIIVATSDSPPGEHKTAPLHDSPTQASSFSLGDVWLVRVDSAGRKLWDNSFGKEHFDWTYKLFPTPDGGAVLSWIAGSTNLGEYDYVISRIDAEGKEVWRRTSDANQSLYATLVMPDGGFLLGGWSSLGANENKSSPNFGASDGWLVRVDANGQALWDLSLGGGENDNVTTLAQTKEGGFIVGLASASGADGNKTTPAYGDFDFWAVKLGPERPTDADNDGISDDHDNCPDTPQGTIVNAHGCSIEQLASCAGSWENHGQYVRAIVQATARFREAGLLTASEQQSILERAAKSDCGKQDKGKGRSF